MAAAPQWAEVAKGVLAIAQAVAIAGAAAWAYFKFVRGRTFAERLEVSLHATPFQQNGVSALQIQAGIRNTGASVVHLMDDVKIVYVYGTAVAEVTPGVSPDWGEKLMLISVFDEHKWIEAQETVSDETLATIMDATWLAFRLELIVGSRKNKRWSATAIVPATNLDELEERDATPELGRPRAHAARGTREDSQGSRGAETQGRRGARAKKTGKGAQATP